MNNKEHSARSGNSGGGSASGQSRLVTLDIAIFCFGLFVFISGIYMCFFALTGTDVWFYSPGFFPCFIGVMLMLSSLFMAIKNLRAGARLGKDAVAAVKAGADPRRAVRLLTSIGLLAIYVFVLIGRVHFVLATFAYLAVSMIVFRKDGFAVWKLLLISAAATGVIYLVFAVIAAVPLP